MEAALPSTRIPSSPGWPCAFSPLNIHPEGNTLVVTTCQHLFPHFCQTPSHHKSFSQSENPRGGMRGVSFAGSYLSPRTGALPAGAQREPSSRNNLSGAASLLCFLPGQVIYPGKPGVPARSSLSRHLREPPAGPREGLLGVLGYLCLLPLLFSLPLS